MDAADGEYRSREYSAQDGPRLFHREYGSACPDTALVSLPG